MSGSHDESRGTGPALDVRGLAVTFPGEPSGARIEAVSEGTWSVERGQMLAIVGESGSGKSVSALAAMGLLPRGARVERGSIGLQIDGHRKELVGPGGLSGEELRRVRGRHLAMIFQEPMTSLNPVLSIQEQIAEVIVLHRPQDKKRTRELVMEALRTVRIDDPARRLKQYPHELSGGMRQRVMIAMAIASEPSVLLADEPTTALDVTVQKHILDLLGELRHSRGMAVVLITHDLGVVADHADVTCVMFGGRVVECGATRDVLERPLHPYTRALLACRPNVHQRVERLATVGELLTKDDKEELVVGGERLVPWWPFAEVKPQGEPVLMEVAVGRKVAVWRSNEALGTWH